MPKKGRQEMVQTALHNYVLSPRQGPGLVEVPYEAGGAPGGQPLHKIPVDIKAGIVHALCLKISMKQRARSAADVQH